MMAEFSLPFRPDMEAAVLAGTKTCTTRSKQYGEPGDIFKLKGRVFKISEPTIRELLSEHGVKLRTRAETMALRAEVEKKAKKTPGLPLTRIVDGCIRCHAKYPGLVLKEGYCDDCYKEREHEREERLNEEREVGDGES